MRTSNSCSCGLAVSHSFGLRIFEERDPFCFMDPSQIH